LWAVPPKNPGRRKEQAVPAPTPRLNPRARSPSSFPLPFLFLPLSLVRFFRPLFLLACLEHRLHGAKGDHELGFHPRGKSTQGKAERRRVREAGRRNIGNTPGKKDAPQEKRLDVQINSRLAPLRQQRGRLFQPASLRSDLSGGLANFFTTASACPVF